VLICANLSTGLNQFSSTTRKPPSFCFILNSKSMLSLSSLKPTTYVPRYPRWMIGRPLLVATSALASLGDAMFGYSQGIIAANQVQPSFIKRMFGRDVTMEQIQTSTTGVNPFIIGAWSNSSALHSTSIFNNNHSQLSLSPVLISRPFFQP
jgi:hypothetical protein